MTGDRFVVLGLAAPRAPWFRSVARWATEGSLAVDFVKCLSGAEIQGRLRQTDVSAVLADASHPDTDDRLARDAGAAGALFAVVGASSGVTGSAPVVSLPLPLDRERLLETLIAGARPVGVLAAQPSAPGSLAERTGVPVAPGAGRYRGTVAMVCGPGGTGASTTAIALAQGLGRRNPPGGVLLVDGCLDGEQAVLHGASGPLPSIADVIDASRRQAPTDAALRSFALAIPDRGYDLLPGLHHRRVWPVLTPAPVGVAVDGLRRAWSTVVFDVPAGVGGEADAGSTLPDAWNSLPRAAASCADAVFVVGRPGLKGVHALVRTVERLAEHGVEPARLVPTVIAGPPRWRGRSEVTAAIHGLLPPELRRQVLFVPVADTDILLRDGRAFPARLVRDLAARFTAVVAEVAHRSDLATGGAPRSRAEVPG